MNQDPTAIIRDKLARMWPYDARQGATRDVTDKTAQYLDREEVLAALDGTWQTDPPTPGRWRVSIRPEIRRGFPSVVECEVWPSASGMTVNYRPGSDPLPIDQDWFVGAKWQRIEEVADPFDAVELPHSR